jgi:hypothetical protein
MLLDELDADPATSARLHDLAQVIEIAHEPALRILFISLARDC